MNTLFAVFLLVSPMWAQNATASLWQCGVTPEPWWAHTLRVTHVLWVARMERIQPTNPEPTPGEESTAQWERRRPKDWESVCGDINPRLITLRGRSMRSRITPCIRVLTRFTYTWLIRPR